jgi:hypothetical protein
MPVPVVGRKYGTSLFYWHGYRSDTDERITSNIMNAHRQAIESAWENLLGAIDEASQAARSKKSDRPEALKEVAAKLETLHAAVRGMGNAWTGIRDLLPIEPIEAADKSDVPGALPEASYWKPLAKALFALGGAAQTGDAIAAVGEAMESQLKAVDRQPLPTGEIRWVSRTRFARERLKQHGLIRRNMPTGHWELTDAGKRWAQSDRAKLPQPVPEVDPNQQALPF